MTATVFGHCPPDGCSPTTIRTLSTAQCREFCKAAFYSKYSRLGGRRLEVDTTCGESRNARPLGVHPAQ
jgi:hypothetical protein